MVCSRQVVWSARLILFGLAVWLGVVQSSPILVLAPLVVVMILGWPGPGGTPARSLALSLSGLVFLVAFFSTATRFAFDQLHSLAPLLVSVGIAVELPWRDRSSAAGFKLAAFIWGLAAVLIFLTATYALNLRFQFLAGILGLVLGLIALEFSVRLPLLANHALNTLVLLAIGLPIADVFASNRVAVKLGSDSRFYSFSAAKSDPRVFAAWWDYYREQWERMGRQIFMPDPAARLPLRLRPGSEGTLFESRIRINSRGFRGAEFDIPKKDSFRIVALGESTTFGCTLNSTDTPWPDVLARLIADRLRPSRPVEVINAGVPAYSLEHNVQRFVDEILPLQPDLVISYHGFNGFRLLDAALPPVQGSPPPSYCERPIQLLADCEHRLKLMVYNARRDRGHPQSRHAAEDVLSTRYAEAYRALIELTRTNGIGLVLANFSMAVNRASDPAVIEFYRAGFPSVYAQIAANEVHSRLVERLAKENGLRCLDTHIALDGQDEKFIDRVHLTQRGRNDLAEAIFSGIREQLVEFLPKTSALRHP
jgi:lysophospholipase L1-like esterase